MLRWNRIEETEQARVAAIREVEPAYEAKGELLIKKFHILLDFFLTSTLPFCSCIDDSVFKVKKNIDTFIPCK
jgi:hypothetical protein